MGVVVCVLKIMGLVCLVLVVFEKFLDEEVFCCLVGVEDVLGDVLVVVILVEVVVDCCLVLGCIVCVCCV